MLLNVFASTVDYRRNVYVAACSQRLVAARVNPDFCGLCRGFAKGGHLTLEASRWTNRPKTGIVSDSQRSCLHDFVYGTRSPSLICARSSMDRVLPSEGRGCWFDPSRAHQELAQIELPGYAGITFSSKRMPSAASAEAIVSIFVACPRSITRFTS